MLYFGDNICSDAYPSKHFANWGTVLVLEEMDAEGYLCSDGTVPGHELDAKDGASGPNTKRRKVLEVRSYNCRSFCLSLFFPRREAGGF